MMATSTTRKSPERILLCRTDHLGDVILALPCALLTRRLFPQSHIAFLVSSYTAPVVNMLKDIDDVFEVDKYEKAGHLAKTLKRMRFDVAIALYPEFWLARTLWSAQIPLRAGIAYRWFSILFNFRHPEHRKHNVRHELEYNLSLVYATFGGKSRVGDLISLNNVYPLNLKVPLEAVHKVDSLLRNVRQNPRRIVAIHPGGGGSAHRWPLESFCKLGARIGHHLSCTVLVTGGRGEELLCEAVSRAAGKDALNFCGKLSLPELTEVYRNCDLLVTNSTGPLHLGRAIGTTVLGLFPADPAMSPVRWGPYRQPDNALVAPEAQSMSGLAVDAVFERTLSLLGDQT